MPIADTEEFVADVQAILRLLPHETMLTHYDATADDYEHVTDEDLKCEFIDGELIVHSPASLKHEDLQSFVSSLIREFVASRGLGRTFGSNAVMQLGERRFSPDISVLKTEHDDRIDAVLDRVVGPMDLVVELISKSTRRYDQQTKLPLYREGRVGEIWIIDAARKQFEVHALRGDDYASQTLSAGRWESVALPGLVVDVSWFWKTPLPSLRDCQDAPV